MTEDYLNLLQQLVSIPSISTNPDDKNDCLKAASWLKNQFESLGLEHCQFLETPELPIVYADWLHVPKAPTYLIYAHYDVQSPEPLNEWKTKPFEACRVGDEVFGRGVADDKGNIVVILLTLKQLFDQNDGKLPVNIKFFIEGGEEKGSPYLKDTIVRHIKLLQSDIAIVADGSQTSPDLPEIITSLRGILYQEITVRAHDHDLHSGIYGGRVVNPALILSTILSDMKDNQNRITIPGFYDDVQLQYYGEKKETDKDVKQWISEQGFSPTESAKVRPSFDINGMWSGYIGEGSKTIIPATAHAKISFRLVANQNPQKIAELMENWINSRKPKGVEITVETKEMAEPVFVDTEHSLIQKAARDLENVFGNRPQFIKSGGTIGAAADIQSSLNIPLLIIGFPLSDSNLHAPNEKIHLPTMLKGIEALKKILS